MFIVKILHRWDGPFTDIYMFSKNECGDWIAKPMELVFEKKEIKRGEVIQPTLTIDDMNGKEFFQALTDGLAEIGYVAKQDKQIEGELKATKHHLKDMQSIVFKILEINKEEKP